MSSILDLSSEADRLEQALKDNDLLSLRKILSIHQNKFSLVPGIQWNLLVPPGSRIHSVSGWENFTSGPGAGGVGGIGGCCVGVGGGGIDPASNRTRSHSAASVGRHSVNSLLPAADLQLRKFSHSNPLQTCPMSVLSAGPFEGPIPAAADARVPDPDSRRDSCCTDIGDVPVPHVFRTALHVAIQHNAVSALTLLLASGVDPNRIPGPTSLSGTVPDGLRRDGVALPDSLFGSRKHSRDSSVGYPNNGYNDSAVKSGSGSGQDGGGGGGGCSSSRKTSFGSAEGNNHRRPDRMSSFGTAVSRRLRLPVRSMNNITSATSSSESRSMDVEPEVTAVPDRRTQPLNDHHHHHHHQRSWNFYGEYTLEHLYTLPPLFMAAAFRNEVAVRLLLQYGASPAAQDRLGCTPLHLATSDEFFSVDCAMTLVKHGAKLHARNSFGVTPCHVFPELLSRQTRFLDRHLVTLENYFRNRDKAGKNPDGGRGGGGRGDHFRFGASLFRRSRKGGESRKGTARGAKDLHQRRHRWIIDRDKDSSVDRDRSASISSSKSRLSFNVNVSSSVTQNHLEEVEMDVVNNDLEKVQ